MADPLQPVPREDPNTNPIEWRQWYERLRNLVNSVIGSQVNFSGRIRVADNTETAVAGDIRYNTGTNKHQGFDGTGWNDLY